MKRKKYLACCVAASMMLGVASPAMVGATAPDDYSANEITDIENVSVFDEDIENSDVQDNEEVSSLEDEDKACAERLDTLKAKLRAHGYALCGEERTKLCLLPKSFGYTGTALAEILTHSNIYCEFSDADHLVMMFTPETSDLIRMSVSIDFLDSRKGNVDRFALHLLCTK